MSPCVAGIVQRSSLHCADVLSCSLCASTTTATRVVCWPGADARPKHIKGAARCVVCGQLLCKLHRTWAAGRRSNERHGADEARAARDRSQGTRKGGQDVTASSGIQKRCARPAWWPLMKTQCPGQ